ALVGTGQVLVVGGGDGVVAWPTAEIYEPATGEFTPVGNLSVSRGAGHSATLLASGQVLIVGGTNTAEVELFDPGTHSFSLTAEIGTARGGHSATLLPSGAVLIAGGIRLPFMSGTPFLKSAELYLPADSP